MRKAILFLLAIIPANLFAAGGGIAYTVNPRSLLSSTNTWTAGQYFKWVVVSSCTGCGGGVGGVGGGGGFIFDGTNNNGFSTFTIIGAGYDFSNGIATITVPITLVASTNTLASSNSNSIYRTTNTWVSQYFSSATVNGQLHANSISIDPDALPGIYFRGSPNSSISSSGPDRIAFVILSAQRAEFSTMGIVVQNGNFYDSGITLEGAPSYSFISSTNSGLWWNETSSETTLSANGRGFFRVGAANGVGGPPYVQAISSFTSSIGITSTNGFVGGSSTFSRVSAGDVIVSSFSIRFGTFTWNGVTLLLSPVAPTNGQVLTSDGSNGVSFQTPSGGGGVTTKIASTDTLASGDPNSIYNAINTWPGDQYFSSASANFFNVRSATVTSQLESLSVILSSASGVVFQTRGTAAKPMLNFDRGGPASNAGLGVYTAQDLSLDFTVNGSQQAQVDTSGITLVSTKLLRMPGGTAAAPPGTFTSAQSMGWYAVRFAPNALGWTTVGRTMMVLDANGSLGVGGKMPRASLHVSTTEATTPLVIIESTNTFFEMWPDSTTFRNQDVILASTVTVTGATVCVNVNTCLVFPSSAPAGVGRKLGITANVGKFYYLAWADDAVGAAGAGGAGDNLGNHLATTTLLAPYGVDSSTGVFTDTVTAGSFISNGSGNGSIRLFDELGINFVTLIASRTGDVEITTGITTRRISVSSVTAFEASVDSFTVRTGTVSIAGNNYLWQSTKPASGDLIFHLRNGREVYLGGDNAGAAGGAGGGDNFGSHISTNFVTLPFGFSASSGVISSSLTVRGIIVSTTGALLGGTTIQGDLIAGTGGNGSAIINSSLTVTDDVGVPTGYGGGISASTYTVKGWSVFYATSTNAAVIPQPFLLDGFVVARGSVTGLGTGSSQIVAPSGCSRIDGLPKITEVSTDAEAVQMKVTAITATSFTAKNNSALNAKDFIWEVGCKRQ